MQICHRDATGALGGISGYWGTFGGDVRSSHRATEIGPGEGSAGDIHHGKEQYFNKRNIVLF